MASLARRPNGRWRPRYRDAAGKQHARHFDRMVDAQAWLDSVTTSVLTGASVDPERTRVTLAEWAGQWLESKVDLEPTTRRCYETSLQVHILPVWGPVRLGDITHQGIASWVAALSRSGKSASTVRHAHRVLSLILALAVRDGRLARNPAVGVPLPRTVRGEQIFLTHEQVDDLAEAAGPNRLAILFLAYTGVRYGEMAALRVRNLNLLRRRALIAEAVVDVNGHAVFGTPENHQRRQVPIPRFPAEELAEHVAGKAPSDVVLAAEKGGVLECGLLRPSFVPPPDVRRLWMLTRCRVQLMADRTREITRLELMLEDASITVSSVAASLTSVSARAMLGALISGESDPRVLADLVKGKMRRRSRPWPRR